MAGLSEELCLATTAVRVEVVQGVARDVTLALPAGLVVDQVNGFDSRRLGGPPAGCCVCAPLDPVPSRTDMSFVVQAEMRVPREGAVVVPLVRMPAAERETGGIAVDVVGAGEIAGREARGLDPTHASELGDIVAGRESPSMLAFRLKPIGGAEPRALGVTVVRYTPQAVLVANVEEARYRALASDDGRLLVHARYAVRNNQRSFLKVSLPSGSTVWSAEVAGRPVRPGVAERDAVLLHARKRACRRRSAALRRRFRCT